MYGILPKLTKENIFSRISDFDIFTMYLDGFGIGSNFSAPYREDNNPSCSVYYEGGKFKFSDFGMKVYGLDALALVQWLFNLEFRQALEKINNDFNLELEGYTGEKNHKVSIASKDTVEKYKREKRDTIIRVKRKDWEKHDLEFWKQFGWTKELLIEAKISPIDYFWITNEKYNNMQFIVTNKKVYNYDYYWHGGIFRRKLYFPENFKYSNRFLSNIDNTVLPGWHMLPKSGNLIIITKSYKDHGPFLRLGYNVVSVNNENSFLPEEVFLNKIDKRFRYKLIIFDNDHTGIIRAEEFSQKYNISYTYLPVELLNQGVKDPSDYIKRFGINSFNSWLQTEIERLDITSRDK